MMALVTGGSRGIGFALAEYFASQGMDLVLLAQHQERLNVAKNRIIDKYPQCGIHSLTVNMENIREIESCIDNLLESSPPLAILVNSAGLLRMGASDISVTELQKLLTVNLTSTIVITNKIATYMRNQGQGHIFNIASLAGIEHKSKLAAYAASKAGLISYSWALYREMLAHDINVTCICPSVVNTDMTNDGRIENEKKIQVNEIVSAVDFVLSLSEHTSIPELEIHCKIIDMESF